MSRNPRAFKYPAISTAVLLALLFIPRASAAEDKGWRLRIDLGIVDPSGDQAVVEVDGGTAAVKVDSGSGVGARGEYQFSRRLGLDFGALAAGSVGFSSSAGIGKIGTAVEVSSFTPVTVGLNVHLLPEARPDLYVGPLLAYATYSDVSVRAGLNRFTTGVSVDNDVGFGAILGLDLPIGKKGWMVNLNLRQIKTKMNGREGENRVDADYDPTIFAIGFGYRF